MIDPQNDGKSSKCIHIDTINHLRKVLTIRVKYSLRADYVISVKTYPMNHIEMVNGGGGVDNT